MLFDSLDIKNMTHLWYEAFLLFAYSEQNVQTGTSSDIVLIKWVLVSFHLHVKSQITLVNVVMINLNFLDCCHIVSQRIERYPVIIADIFILWFTFFHIQISKTMGGEKKISADFCFVYSFKTITEKVTEAQVLWITPLTC